MSSLSASVVSIINEVCQPNVPNLDDPNRALLDSGLDSLDYASLLMALEDKYGLSFSQDEMAELDTLNKVVGFLEGRGVS